MNRIKTKYTRDDRKHIVESIENLKNDEDYVAIFEILTDDTANSYTQNSNGIFLNLSAVSDTTLERINKYLKKINKKRVDQIEVDVDVIPGGNISKADRTYKLSNYEKNILKQRNLKKVLNDENEYEELRFSAKNKKASEIPIATKTSGSSKTSKTSGSSKTSKISKKTTSKTGKKSKHEEAY